MGAIPIVALIWIHRYIRFFDRDNKKDEDGFLALIAFFCLGILLFRIILFNSGFFATHHEAMINAMLVAVSLGILSGLFYSKEQGKYKVYYDSFGVKNNKEYIVVYHPTIAFIEMSSIDYVIYIAAYIMFLSAIPSTIIVALLSIASGKKTTEIRRRAELDHPVA